LSGDASHSCTVHFLDKAHLIKIKKDALRRGVWFKALPRIDRVLFDLTIKLNTVVRSFTLTNSILAVARKLEEILQNKLARMIRFIGVPAAQRLSRIAQGWGNLTAEKWANDHSFARYLTIMRQSG